MFYSRDEFQSRMTELMAAGWSAVQAYSMVSFNEQMERSRYERERAEEKMELFDDDRYMS